MSEQSSAGTSSGSLGRPFGHGGPAASGTTATGGWSFVYVFFSNGTPFDAPNRSEPCPLP